MAPLVRFERDLAACYKLDVASIFGRATDREPTGISSFLKGILFLFAAMAVALMALLSSLSLSCC